MVKCTRCNGRMTKSERESFVRGYPFPVCDRCASVRDRITELESALREAIEKSNNNAREAMAAFRAKERRIAEFETAARDVLRVAYVGDGKIVCPPAFLEPIRALAKALRKGGA